MVTEMQDIKVREKILIEKKGKKLLHMQVLSRQAVQRDVGRICAVYTNINVSTIAA